MNLKEMKWKAVFYAAIYIILGLVLLFFPDTSARTLAYAIAVSAILVGGFTVITYLRRDVARNYYRNDFVAGLTAVIVGIMILRRAEFVISIIPFLLGVLVIFSGILKLQHFVDIKRMQGDAGAAMLMLALINVLLGILLVANPFEAVTLLFRVLGIGMIFSGVTDLLSSLYLTRRLDHYIQEQEALDVTAREVEGR